MTTWSHSSLSSSSGRTSRLSTFAQSCFERGIEWTSNARSVWSLATPTRTRPAVKISANSISPDVSGPWTEIRSASVTSSGLTGQKAGTRSGGSMPI